MEIKKITTWKKSNNIEKRPENFKEFVWQEDIKKILETAIESWKKRNSNLWHILFSWQSWYWKTTLAQIIANTFWVKIKIVTWYAITKWSELISILNSLENNDILFIDEIHRIKPNIEEILYTAMEDFCIDMVMPEWWNIRVNLNKFTLIWATTKLEALTIPLKNRFVYKFHFKNYSESEKLNIIKKYLNIYWLDADMKLISIIWENLEETPRTIKNFCIKLRDYIITKWLNNNLNINIWEDFVEWGWISKWWIENIHKQYIEILKSLWNRPVWLKTIAIKMWMNEKSVEEDIEPLLLKLWKIEKTSRWRILLYDI